MINLPLKNTTPPQASPLKAGAIATLDLDKLETLLTDLETEHQHLLELAGLQRDAITNADPMKLGTIVEQTAQTLGRIATIERTRQQTIKIPDGSIPTVKQKIGRASCRERVFRAV